MTTNDHLTRPQVHKAVMDRCIAALERFGKATGLDVEPFNDLDAEEREVIRGGLQVVLAEAGYHDMLAALRAVVSVADRNTVEFDMAHAAIAKAAP